VGPPEISCQNRLLTVAFFNKNGKLEAGYKTGNVYDPYMPLLFYVLFMCSTLQPISVVPVILPFF
jgi:hypothetical protein